MRTSPVAVSSLNKLNLDLELELNLEKQIKLTMKIPGFVRRLLLLLVIIPLAWYAWNWLFDRLAPNQLEVVGTILLFILVGAIGLFVAALKLWYRSCRHNKPQ